MIIISTTAARLLTNYFTLAGIPGTGGGVAGTVGDVGVMSAQARS
jgi:hypothetical protein